MKNFTLSDWFKKKSPKDEVKLVKTEFADRIILGNAIYDRCYDACLSSGRVENMYDPNLKLIVLAKSRSREHNKNLIDTLTNWFREKEDTDINSSKYSDDLTTFVSNMRKESLYEAKTSFGFAISNGKGDVIIYNVGELRHYAKPFNSNGVFNVTYMDHASTYSASLENSHGSYFFYSNIEELYIVTDDIPERYVDEVSVVDMSARNKANVLVGTVNDNEIDSGANVLRIVR